MSEIQAWAPGMSDDLLSDLTRAQVRVGEDTMSGLDFVEGAVVGIGIETSNPDYFEAAVAGAAAVLQALGGDPTQTLPDYIYFERPAEDDGVATGYAVRLGLSGASILGGTE